MRKILFTWKDFWPVLLLFPIGGLYILAGKENKPLIFLGGIGVLLWTLHYVVTQLFNRIDILRSPDFEAIQADILASDKFLNGKIYLGKTYLYSALNGKVYLCKSVKRLEQEVHQPPRSSAYAELKAYVDGEGSVVLARYSLLGENERSAKNLMAELVRIRQQETDRAFE